jgi:hypothetical protein
MKNFYDLAMEGGTYRFTEQMRRAIGCVEGHDDGRLATPDECASWLETEMGELISALVATYGTREERERCRQLRRRGEWRQRRTFHRMARGEHKPITLVWDCVDDHGNKVSPPLGLVPDAGTERPARVDWEAWALDQCTLLDAIEQALRNKGHDHALDLALGRFGMAERHGVRTEHLGPASGETH